MVGLRSTGVGSVDVAEAKVLALRHKAAGSAVSELHADLAALGGRLGVDDLAGEFGGAELDAGDADDGVAVDEIGAELVAGGAGGVRGHGGADLGSHGAGVVSHGGGDVDGGGHGLGDDALVVEKATCVQGCGC